MKRAVLHGVAWVGGLMLLVRAVRYAALFIVAGVLSPRDFGLFAALYVVIDGMVLLQGFGIGHALIYRKERVDEAADTAFFVSLATGAAVFGLAWILAPAVERFYGESGTCELFRAGSIILLIQAIRLVPFRLFEKALDFRKKLLPTLARSVAYFVVAIILALRGAGVWALLGAEIASVFTETASYWLISPWRPRLRFRLDLARQDLTFGHVVLGGSALIFAFRNVDRITLSRMLGTHELGIYAFAYAIANLPATLFVRALNTVLLPSYSSVGGDADRRRTLFFRATSYVAAASLVYVLCVLTFGRHFLQALYGERWLGAVAPLYVLAVFALFRTLSALVGDLLIGTGHPGSFRRIYGLQLAVACAGLYFGARLWGTVGVAVAMAAATGVALVAGWRAAKTTLAASGVEFIRALRGPLVASAALALPSVALSRVLPEPAGFTQVAAASAAVVVAYVAVWFAIDAEVRAEYRKWRSSERQSGPPRDGGWQS